jgi:hypothetical protein
MSSTTEDAKGDGRLLVVSHQMPWVCTVKHFLPKSIPSIYSSLPRSIAKKLHHTRTVSALAQAPTPPLDERDMVPIEPQKHRWGQQRQLSSQSLDLKTIRGPPAIEIHPRRGHSALFSGIRSLGKGSELVHIGWTGSILDEDADPIDYSKLTPKIKSEIATRLYDEKRCVPVYYNDKVACKCKVTAPVMPWCREWKLRFPSDSH